MATRTVSPRLVGAFTEGSRCRSALTVPGSTATGLAKVESDAAARTTASATEWRMVFMNDSLMRMGMDQIDRSRLWTVRVGGQSFNRDPGPESDIVRHDN